MSSQKNRGHGKIQQLPEFLRKEVENRLLDGHTYESISEYLKNMGNDVSYSSVGRYGRDYLRRFEAVRMAKEYAKLLAEDNIDRPTTELHEANNALASQLLMESIMTTEMDAGEKLKLSQAIASLQSAQVRNEKLKIQARKASGEVNAAMRQLKIKVFEQIGSNYPEIANAIITIADEIVQQDMDCEQRL